MVARLIFFLLTSAWALSACATPAGPACLDPLGCVDLAPGEALRIGYLLTFSGAQQPLGTDALGGIALAIQDRQGSLRGHPIELRGEDPGCNREELLAAATRLASVPKLLGVIGPHCPVSVEQVALTFTQAGLVDLALGGALPVASGPGWSPPPGFMRLAIDEAAQGELAATFAFQELQARRAAILADAYPYHTAIASAFSERFQKLGGQVTIQATGLPDEGGLQPLLTDLAAAPPDLLFLALFQHQGDTIALQARDLPALADTQLLAVDSLLVDRFVENAGRAALGVYLSGFDLRGATYAEWIDLWIARYAAPPHSLYPVLAYDAAALLLDALDQVAVEREGGGHRIGREALRERLASLRTPPGLLAIYNCSESNCTSNAALRMVRIDSAETGSGRWPPAVIWTPEP